jgi:membrane-associated protein
MPRTFPLFAPHDPDRVSKPGAYMDFNPLDLILHLDVYLDLLVTQYGTWVYAILFLVIFCETGLVVMPFLPGDSLLFIAGAVAAGGGMDPVLLACLLMAAAILGDSTNYIIGRTAGDKLFSNPNSKIFRRDYLTKTQEFYGRHGGKTVTLARFLPIIRTFAPFVAGLGRMPYLRFLGFSVLGSVLWVGGLVTLGFFFGNIPFIKKNLTLLVLAIILISLLPMIIGLIRSRIGRSAEAR